MHSGNGSDAPEKRYSMGMAQAIRNFGALAQSDLRSDALSIAEAAYRAIDTREAIYNKVSLYDSVLTVCGEEYALAGRRVHFVGIGKCAFAAARALEELLGEVLVGGVALDVSPITDSALTRVQMYIGTHPEPSDVNMEATEHIFEYLNDCTEHDIVLMLISGGGSTLLCLHDKSMTCMDEQVLFDELTAGGATITELNTVRKHISKARGGGLAKAAYPAEVVALIVSDVPGNDMQFIASGPTVMDDTTVADAHGILVHYGVQVPSGVQFVETIKDPAFFERVHNVLFISNRDALAAMSAEAAARGFSIKVLDDHFSGEAREVAARVLEALRAAPARAAVLLAGESTVRFANTSAYGNGGRNQELALSLVPNVAADELVLALASDGHDNSDHAGAIADQYARAHAEALTLSVAEYLERHASYDFFAATGDALETGYTGSNVSDLVIALKQ